MEPPLCCSAPHTLERLDLRPPACQLASVPCGPLRFTNEGRLSLRPLCVKHTRSPDSEFEVTHSHVWNLACGNGVPSSVGSAESPPCVKKQQIEDPSGHIINPSITIDLLTCPSTLCSGLLLLLHLFELLTNSLKI